MKNTANAPASFEVSGTPDLIVHNAKLFTGDPAKPWGSAVAIEQGRVLAVGRRPKCCV